MRSRSGSSFLLAFSMVHGSSLCAALALCFFGTPATTASERFEQWSLEQHGDFVFALSSKRPFRWMIGPQHQNSRSFAIKRINTLRSCSYLSTVRSRTGRIRFHSDSEDRRAIWCVGFDAALGKRTGLCIFGIARPAGGTCLVPKEQRSRGCEIGSLLFPQRPGCEHADNQSHGH